MPETQFKPSIRLLLYLVLALIGAYLLYQFFKLFGA